MVSNPVECDFTLSSLLEDTAGHSLSLPCLEWEVPREFLLHRSELIPPPVLGFERFEENKYTSIKRRRMIVQCKKEDVEKNGYPLTGRLTEMQHTDPASPRTGLGKNYGDRQQTNRGKVRLTEIFREVKFILYSWD